MKAAAYARYSTDKQTENSIAYQMEAITKYCLDRHIDLCAAFSDEAASGTNANREGFQALVAAAKRHEFDAVVIYDISRGSRDVVDWFSFRKAMRAAGVRHIRYVHLFFQKIFYIHFQNKYKIAPRGKTPSGAILYYL